jgi:UDP-N-acetylmuramoyl-tripeptide--D-alanyl-D-alanine ligase
MADRLRQGFKRIVFRYFGAWAWLVLRARKPTIVGVTGSVGKTTTKEAIAAVLSHPRAAPIVGTVGKTPGNLNEDFGLPLTVLRFPTWPISRLQLVGWMCAAPVRALRFAAGGRYPDVLVLEYAVCFDGNVPALARLAPPTIAVVTNVGPAHLEVLGTIERIAEAKGALVRAAPKSGLVVLGTDNPCLARMAAEATAPVVTVSGSGRALSDNVARAVGGFLGIPQDVVDAALQEMPPLARRLHFRDLDWVKLIDDSFNANPLSMTLALHTLRDAAVPGQRKVALLGYMAELGGDAAQYHEQIGALARECADVVVGVGEPARHFRSDHWFEDARACSRGLPVIVRPGDLVLVKGSSSSHMYDVADAISAMDRPELAGARDGAVANLPRFGREVDRTLYAGDGP